MHSPGDHQSPSGQSGEYPAEIAHSFRWTQALAQKLVRDPATAADLSQEAWTLAVQRFGDEVPGQAWLRGTVRSLAFRLRRSNRRRRRYEAESAEEGIAEGALDVVMRSEAQACVARAVDELPMALRLPVILRYQEGLSIAAIAERLDCPTSTASDRVQRGLAQLRSELRSGSGRESRAWRACLVLAAPLGPTPLPGTAPVGAAFGSIHAARAPAGTLAGSYLTALTMKKFVLIGILALAGLLSVAILVVDGAGAGHWASPEVATEADPGAAPEAAPEAERRTAAAPRRPGPDATRADTSQRFGQRVEVELAPAPEPRPDDFAIAARVVDARGRPVPESRMIASANGWRSEAVANEEGVIELRLNRQEIGQLSYQNIDLAVVGGVYQTLWYREIDSSGTSEVGAPTVGGREDLGTIVLLPAGAVQGRVDSSTKTPLAGAQVRAFAWEPDNPKRYEEFTGDAPDPISDGDGHFLIGHLPPGEVTLGARHGECMAWAPRVKATVVEGATVGPLLLTAHPAPVIEGRVVDPQGNPLPGVQLRADNQWSNLDTARSGPSGAFRIGLRTRKASWIRAKLPGWRQVSPTTKELFGPGSMTVVMEPQLPPAQYAVRVLCAETNQEVYNVRISVLTESESEEALGRAVTPKSVHASTQLARGIPVDFVPGRDRLRISGTGHEPRVISTAELQDSAPHITTTLQRTPGTRGRLLENGQPVAGARVLLSLAQTHRALPREFLRDGQTFRCSPELPVPLPEIAQAGSLWESVLGLDGAPPMYRQVTGPRSGGTRTDDQGNFQIHDEGFSFMLLAVRRGGQNDRLLRAVAFGDGDSSGKDLGDIEIAPAAALSGNFEFSGLWSPEAFSVSMDDPKIQVALGEDGSFSIDGLQPGPTYFSLAGSGRGNASFPSPNGSTPLKDIPLFHVDLAPGESRHVVVSLDQYVPASFDLEVMIGGEPAPDSCRLEAFPVDDPARLFRVSGAMESGRMTGEIRALGLSGARLIYTMPDRAWVALPCPGPPLDFSAGRTEQRRINIPAGRVQITMDQGNPATKFDGVNLVLEGGPAPLKAHGILFKFAERRNAVRTLDTPPIPPGSYRGTLRPWYDVHQSGADVELAEFDVTIRSAEVTTIDLRK